MSLALIDLNPDLKRLREEGYEILMKGGYLFIRHIPYVNSKKEIHYGILVSELTFFSNTKVGKPSTHVIKFQGEIPCHNDGTPIRGIYNSAVRESIFPGFILDHVFSSKPSPDGYPDYYQKVVTYANTLSAPAKSIDPNVTEKTFFVPPDENEESVFNYPDTNASRASVSDLAEKLKGQKIAIIGLGGTGSYILDFLVKTPVQEIHLFDDDYFQLHNAFRSPAAPSLDQVQDPVKKVFYYARMYSPMRKNIIPHDFRIIEETFNELLGMTYVFIAIDKGAIKKSLFNFLIENKIPFIDCGIGLQKKNETLVGIVRTTTATTEKNDHLTQVVDMADDDDDLYNSNIQIAELNALNAAFAVMKWKKLCGFSADMIHEHHSIFTLNDSQLLNEYTDA